MYESKLIFKQGHRKCKGLVILIIALMKWALKAHEVHIREFLILDYPLDFKDLNVVKQV